MAKKEEILNNPDYDRLVNHFRMYREKLSEVISVRDFLTVTAGPELEAYYMTLIGNDKLRVFRLEYEVRRMKRKSDILQTAINANNFIDINILEKRLDREFAEWQDKLEEYTVKVVKARSVADSTLTDEESYEISLLYKDLVNKLHPEVNPGMNKQDRYLWQKVQHAFKTSDLKELRVLSVLFDTGHKISVGKPSDESISIEEIRHGIEKLKNIIAATEAQTALIRHNYPFTLTGLLEDRKQIDKEKKKMYEQKVSLLQYKCLLDFQLTNLVVIVENGKFRNN